MYNYGCSSLFAESNLDLGFVVITMIKLVKVFLSRIQTVPGSLHYVGWITGKNMSLSA